MRRVYSAAHGDYVLCCKYSDRDPHDQWQIGFLDYCVNYHNTGKEKDNVFVMQNPQRSYFKCCFLLTPEEGEKILSFEDPSVLSLNNSPVEAFNELKLRYSERY
jgi:hypothetical protein